MAFGSFLRGVAAQVNPFDRGRTYSTVQDEDRRRKQAEQALRNTQASQVLKVSQPARPRVAVARGQTSLPKINISNTVKAIKDRSPNEVTQNLRDFQNYSLDDQVALIRRGMNLGLVDRKAGHRDLTLLLTGRDIYNPNDINQKPNQSFFNKLRDVVDANTAADQYRRRAVGRSAIDENPGNLLSNTIGAVPRMLNTAANQIPEVYYTLTGELAARTGNQEALANALKMQDAVRQGYQKNKGGLFNAGTLYDAEEAKRGDLVTGFKRIGLGTVEAGLDVASLGLAGVGGKQIAKQGIRAGLKSQIPNIAKNALLNTAQGGVSAARQDGSARDIALSSLLGGGIGTAGDIGLAVGGGSISRLFKGNSLDKLVRASTPDAVAQAVAKTVGRGVKLSDDALEVIASTTDKQLIETVLGLEVDKSIRLTGGEYGFSQEAADRLKSEGITSIKGYDSPYGAEYYKGDIRLRDANMGRDEVLYHELGHDIWSRRVSVADKQLLKSLPPGGAQQEAIKQGRSGYDLVEEDFADYVSKALRGQSNQIPKEVRGMIERYAKAMKAQARRQGIPESALTGRGFVEPDSALHIPGKGIYAKLSPSQLKILKNEVKNIPFSKGDMPHLSPTEKLIRSGAREVSQEELAALSPNIAKALQNAPQEPVEALTKQLDNAAKAELDTVAKQLGLKNSDELVELTKTKPVSDISEANTIKETLYGPQAEQPATRNLNIFQKASPDRLLREYVTRPTERVLNKLVGAMQRSENPISRGVGRLFTGASTEAGRTPEQLAARRLMRGSAELGNIYGEDVASRLSRGISPESQTRIWAALDPEQASKIGVGGKLTADEQVAVGQLRNIIDSVSEGNASRGLITAKQAANPSYIKRGYEIFEPGGEFDKAYQSTKNGLLSQFKGRKDVSVDTLASAITDPYYLVAKKTAQSHAAWGMVDYGNFLKQNGVAVPQARPGYVQLPNSKLYGEAAGQFVPRQFAEDFTGFQYSIGMVQAFSDMVSAYDRLGIRRAKKGLLTVANPAVRFGNQFSNRVVFANMNGINPVEFNAVYAKVRGAMKRRDPYYLEAVEQGLIGTDITTADFARRLGQYGDENMAKKAVDWVKSSYSQADDRARVTAYTIHRNRGYSPQEAAEMTQRGFQDYNSVGFFYDLAAKTPLVGNAFVRFAGDAVRIAKNAAVDHPLRSAATIALWATFVDGMSKLSGESAEDKGTREGRFGAPKIPFTDISLTVQTPWGEINAARFLPFYALNEVNSDVSRFLPIQQNPLKPQGFQDPLLGQFGQIAADTDFRGKSIKDPNNVTYDSRGNVKKFPDLPAEDQKNNVLRFLFNQNVPLGREIDTIRSASQGQPDIYGKERSLPQAIARSLGIKVEQFGSEQAKKTRSLNDYFDGNVERVKKFTKDNPDLEQAYYTFNNPTRDRQSGQKTSNLVSPERWAVVRSDASGRLYGFLRQEAELANKKDGKPIDPIFQLPTPEQQRQVMELRSRPTGDDIETEEILRATKPWYKEFEAAERDYYAKNGEYFGKLGLPDTQNERVKAYGAIKYPEQTKLIQRYYEIKSKDADAAKEYYRANRDKLSEDFDKYAAERLTYINAKREIEGFPPIDASVFNNVTFGYEDDERKVFNELAYGRGFGFGGFGQDGGVQAGYITNFLGQLGGRPFKDVPKIRLKQPSATRLPSGTTRKVNIKSLALPNTVPTFDSTKGKG